MRRKLLLAAGLAALAGALAADGARALGRERWTDPQPYGLFFNDYDPNFYTGFAPRVQDPRRIKIHLGRGNQLRVRMVVPDETIDAYLLDQVARHDLYRELIDAGVLVLTTNTAWEDYHQRFEAEGLRDLAARRDGAAPAEWRELNLRAIDRLNPERLYHIQVDFGKLLADFEASLRAAQPPLDLEARLDLVNELFHNRIFLDDLDEARTVAFDELRALAAAGDSAAFRSRAEAFFQDVTDGIYPVRDGRIDYWEYTAIYPAGTYDTTTQYKGRAIPMITTPGVWRFIPREHGTGMIGMVDYISRAGYYGLIPMLTYEYGGGSAYNSIHNTGISNWIAGHPLLPREWKEFSGGSRNGKPYNRVALTSRGPVSHGCTRLNNGHLAELREMFPSSSERLIGIPNYRNVSHCYDVFDRRGDGADEIMGVQYYFAFRHTKSRVAKEIWAQNNRKDFYDWLYGPEMNYGPLGEVTFDDVCTGKFVQGKAREGRRYRGLRLYEAPYQPETLQFYKIRGVEALSDPGFEFNRELRRVGHGYRVDRAKLFLE